MYSPAYVSCILYVHTYVHLYIQYAVYDMYVPIMEGHYCVSVLNWDVCLQFVQVALIFFL